MPFHIFTINGTVFLELFLHQWIVDVVIIDPSFISGVVRRIDVDALDTIRIAGESCFEGVQIIAVDNEVIFFAG